MKERCENCSAFRLLSEKLTSCYWHCEKHFCSLHYILVDKNDTCNNWKKLKFGDGVYCNNIDELIKNVEKFLITHKTN